MLIRHGETDYNAQGRIQGQINIPLNEMGKQQCESLAHRLSVEKWDCIYSSDLMRARDTAQIVGDKLALPVMTDIRLRERSFGKLEGLTREERKQYEDQDEASLYVESTANLVQRGMGFLNNCVDQDKQSRVIVVTHGGWINHILQHILNKSHRLRVDNTSVSVLDYGKHNQQWTHTLLNCTMHLDKLN